MRNLWCPYKIAFCPEENQLRNSTKVFMSILQNDGRLSGKQYPFDGKINKVCLLLFTTSVKKPINNMNMLKEKTLILMIR